MTPKTNDFNEALAILTDARPSVDRFVIFNGEKIHTGARYDAAEDTENWFVNTYRTEDYNEWLSYIRTVLTAIDVA